METVTFVVGPTVKICAEPLTTGIPYAGIPTTGNDTIEFPAELPKRATISADGQ